MSKYTTDTGEHILDRHPEVCESGQLNAYYKSDDSDLKMGLSVGLGDGRMVYAGELESGGKPALALFSSQNPRKRIVLAEDVDGEQAEEVILAIQTLLKG